MPLKVLIVDDSATDRMIIKNILKDSLVLTAGDGVEALNLLEKDPDVDLMILDLNMPKMDGFQVLEQIKGEERLRRLRTIILTNYDELDNETRGLKLGAIDYIRKPIHVDSLKARLTVHFNLILARNQLEKQLQEQEVTFEMVFNQAPVGIAISHNKESIDSMKNQYFSVNPAFEKITGRTKEELLKLGWSSITHPEDAEDERRNYSKLLSGEIDGYSMDKRFIRPDGSVVWGQMIVSPLVLQANHPFNHIALVKDITESKLMEKKLWESERNKSLLLSNLQGMAYRCAHDPDWTMEFVSSGCLELTGYSPENLINNGDVSFNDMVAPEYRSKLKEKWESVLAQGLPFRHEYEIITASGDRKWVLEIGQGILNDQGEMEALEGIIIDISDRKGMENTLRYNSEHDEWTDLFNRRQLETILREDGAGPLLENRALISINLSRIHSLNITYGFQYSQKLIRKVADELKKLCTDQCLLFNTYEYRFVFYKKGYEDSSELKDFCSHAFSMLSSLLDVERIDVGIGVLEIQEGNKQDVESLLKKLLITSEEAIQNEDEDEAIRFYDAVLEEKIHRREILQREFTLLAAGEKAERLFLHFQPVLDLKDNKICGFEALARYVSEELGPVSPLEFIPIIEESKHIIPIGSLILEKATQFVQQLKEKGYGDIPVSVNISAIQLLNKGFVDSLMDVIRQAGINPEQMHLELTESVFSSKFDEINKILALLETYGIQASIDDFGTGYSSLSRERELNISCLKIDKSFIDNLLILRPEQTISGDIISMAHKLGHCVVAEGVEEKEQLDYLKRHGCDRAQGYLISRPLPREAALAFLEGFTGMKD